MIDKNRKVAWIVEVDVDKNGETKQKIYSKSQFDKKILNDVVDDMYYNICLEAPEIYTEYELMESKQTT